MLSHHRVALLLAGATCVVCAQPVAAQSADARDFDIPSQRLGDALRAVSVASGQNILTPTETVVDRQAPALKGRFTLDDALTVLLQGSGLRPRRAGNAIIIELDPDQASSQPAASDIVITGSRIRGAIIASPVIVLGRERIRDRGQATLPDALRTLPQNFGGGQNPGVGQNVPEQNGFDLGGGSSINLRGLGSDATLTLLDGHRLSYNAAKQSVDISGIPLGAVGRLEIVPDGASALFGSDAVAGVVNIILRRDLDGLETGFRLAGTSDGGNFSQIYSATGGKTWTGGNILLAYEYGSNTPIISSQRPYAAIRPNLTIFPGLRHHSALVGLRQDIGSGIGFSLDGLFNTRRTAITFPLNLAGDLSVSRATSSARSQSYGLAPSLTIVLAGGWDLALSGSYGQDKVNYGAVINFGATVINAGSGYYRNRERSIELSGNGPLFELSDGTAKLAVGAGYRNIGFVRFTGVGGAQNIDTSQSDYYGFAELNLPIVRHVTLSAAARYENYRSVGEVVTPKVGLIVAPSPDVSLKASWGKSFRAPTLYQQYQPQTVILYDATDLGGSGYPAGSTALELIGGNRNVTPERSTNWSVTIDVHPRRIAGFSVALSYFSVLYRDRIVIPLPTDSIALSNPLYASRVTANPSSASQAALIGSVNTFLNFSSGAYNPARVVAVVDNSNTNAGRQTVRGFDLLASYDFGVGPGRLAASADVAYIRSEQQLGPGLPVTRLAGTIFNPPHWRARGDLAWTSGPITLSGAVGYVGSVNDNRTVSAVRVHGLTSVDFGLRVRPADGPLRGLDVIASVQNVFNARPMRIATRTYTDAAYDSTNYSPIGRLFSVSVSKKW